MAQRKVSLFGRFRQFGLRSSANPSNDERLTVLSICISDVVLITILLFVALGIVPVLNRLSAYSQRQTSDAQVVVIVSGEVIFRTPLDPSAGSKEFFVNADGHPMTICVGPEGAYVVSSDCMDQFCVHSRPISIPGQSVVCLPNRMILEIVENTGDGSEEISSSVDESSEIDAVAGRVGGYNAP